MNSPSHALLPHVETNTSTLSAVVTHHSEETKKSESLFESFASGLEKSASRFRSRSLSKNEDEQVAKTSKKEELLHGIYCKEHNVSFTKVSPCIKAAKWHKIRN